MIRLILKNRRYQRRRQQVVASGEASDEASNEASDEGSDEAGDEGDAHWFILNMEILNLCQIVTEI